MTSRICVAGSRPSWRGSVLTSCVRGRRDTRSRWMRKRPIPSLVLSRAIPNPRRRWLIRWGSLLLVVLDLLDPRERLSFVLPDVLAMPFEEIAPILGSSPAAARQLASRARHRVQGGGAIHDARLDQHRGMVAAFLAALRSSDFEALVKLLDPEIVVRADQAASPTDAPREVRGARIAAQQAIAFSRGAPAARLALIDGIPGLIVAPRGRLTRVLTFSFAQNAIAQINVLADPARLGELEIALLD